MAPIIQTEDYLVRLKNLIEAADVLERHGFITQPLTDDDLLLKRRCIGCNKGNMSSGRAFTRAKGS
jgi:RNA exonuclease 1